MKTTHHPGLDGMQVCRNGHVITDLLETLPGRGLSHCDRCGAATLSACPTCGGALRGAVDPAGLVPVGVAQPPQFCSVCGAAFPWAQPAPITAAPEPVLLVETFLRRLPRVIRQLRDRHEGRPPFRVEDEHDLEDLLRSLLPLSFDTVRPERRTPAYATGTRTDFLLPAEGITLVIKRVGSSAEGDRLADQLPQDVTYYRELRTCSILVVFVYDPEQRIPDPRQLETAWSRSSAELASHCVVAS
jgi:hypothetical protein